MRSYSVGLVTLIIIVLAGVFALRAVNRFVSLRPTPSPSAIPMPTPMGGIAEASPTPIPTPFAPHEVVPTGTGSFSLWYILSLVGGVALVATVAYKLSYKYYILG